MSEFKYSLFHQRTAENISVEIARLRDSLLSKKDIKATGQVKLISNLSFRVLTFFCQVIF